ncbi:MAG: hypothetical protein EOM40_14050 [Clostridia bacterium]|nr:hypothetical protein [Clostridia bacterium]NCC42999.1 hypothetical protein [Clostridia bacterium]
MAEKRYESDMTRKEKKELERKKLSSMSWKEKAGYIWAYYKLHMAAAVGVILVLSVIGQMIYRSQFETVLSVAILNGGMGDSELMAEDIKKYLGDEDKYHEVSVDSSMYFTGDEQADYTSVMKLTTLVSAKGIDAIISTKEQFDKYEELSAFVPMSELLTADQMEAYGDEVGEYGIHITESEKLEEYGMTVGDEAYLAVFVNSENLENAEEFISYVCEGGKS